MSKQIAQRRISSKTITRDKSRPHSKTHTEIIRTIILIVVTFAAYSPTLRNGFVFDDHAQYVGNGFIRDAGAIKLYFTHGISFFTGQELSRAYRPFHLLFYLILYKLFGVSSFACHAVNVLLYVLNVLLVRSILRKYLTSSQAFWGGAIFSVHPVHVESVAWIAAIPDLLCGAFLFLAIFLYLRGGVFWSLIPFFAASLSKETGLLFPVLVLADQAIFRRIDRKKFLYWMASALILAGGYLLLRWNALGAITHPQPLNLTVLEQAMTVVAFTGRYIWKLLLPVGLTVEYDYEIPAGVINVIIGAAIILSVSLLIGRYRRNAAVVLGAVWFAVLLSPTFLISNLSPPFFAERYLYFCVAPACLIISTFAVRILVQRILLVVLLVFGILTFNRSLVWHDDITLWKDAVEKSPISASAHYNLATSYAAQKDWNSAAVHYQRTLKLRPNDYRARLNLASTLGNQGDILGAMEQTRIFLSSYPLHDAIKAEAVDMLKKLELRRRMLKHLYGIDVERHKKPP